jgi:hypothetical protein
MGLCFANCLLISAWEDEVDMSHGQTSFALQFKRGAAIGRALPWVLAAVAGLDWMVGGPHARASAACAVGSGVLLGVLDRLEHRIGWEWARALVDIALMTPAVPLAAALLRR